LLTGPVGLSPDQAWSLSAAQLQCWYREHQCDSQHRPGNLCWSFQVDTTVKSFFPWPAGTEMMIAARKALGAELGVVCYR
jgi:hypothetical protein